MADTGAPSGAPGASEGAARTSPAPGRTSNATVAETENFSVVRPRNSSQTTDVLGEMPENAEKPMEGMAFPNKGPHAQQEERENDEMVVEHGHNVVLAMLGVKQELTERQVTKVGQKSMSEENQQPVEEGHASQSISQSTMSLKLQSATPVKPAPPEPNPKVILGPSFPNADASEEREASENHESNDSRNQMDQSPKSQPNDELEKQEKEIGRITAEEEDLLEQGGEDKVGQKKGEGIQAEIDGDMQAEEKQDKMLLEQEVEREGRLVEEDSEEQGLMSLLARSRLAPSNSDSDGGERGDSEVQGDKVADRVNSDLPQMVGSVSVSPTDEEEGPTKAKSDPPSHPHNVTASTSSTSTPSSSSISSLRNVPLQTSTGDPSLVSSTPPGLRTTQPNGFYADGVDSNSTSILSGEYFLQIPVYI